MASKEPNSPQQDREECSDDSDDEDLGFATLDLTGVDFDGGVGDPGNAENEPTMGVNVKPEC